MPVAWSFHPLEYERPFARMPKGLDVLDGARRIVRALKATTVTQQPGPHDSARGAMRVTAKPTVSSSNDRLLARSGHSLALPQKFSLSSEHEDSRRRAEPSTARSQSPAPLSGRHAFLRGCDASLHERIRPPALMAIYLVACLSLRFQLFVFQA